MTSKVSGRSRRRARRGPTPRMTPGPPGVLGLTRRDAPAGRLVGAQQRDGVGGVDVEEADVKVSIAEVGHLKADVLPARRGARRGGGSGRRPPRRRAIAAPRGPVCEVRIPTGRAPRRRSARAMRSASFTASPIPAGRRHERSCTANPPLSSTASAPSPSPTMRASGPRHRRRHGASSMWPGVPRPSAARGSRSRLDRLGPARAHRHGDGVVG